MIISDLAYFEFLAKEANIVGGESVTVIKGDSLSYLAKVFCKDASKWPEIYYANPEIEDPDKIYPGQVLEVPCYVPW